MTYNPNKYGALLLQTLPAAVHNEAENEQILSVMAGLMQKGEANLSPEELRLLELLGVLAEEFEAQAYPLPDVPPHEMLKFMLAERGLRQKDLLPVFGSEGIISEVINGKRSITAKQAKSLAGFFQVSAALFI
jgi:HTH-type transcriptional regulator/antitoxin HigA